MLKRSSKKKRPTDTNLLAASIVADVIEEPSTEEHPISNKNINAVALGRLGGLKGGPARAKSLTAEQRREIAKKAAKARWREPSG